MLAGDSARLNEVLEGMANTSSNISIRSMPAADDAPYQVQQEARQGGDLRVWPAAKRVSDAPNQLPGSAVLAGANVEPSEDRKRVV